MKKLIYIILALCLVLALAACGGNSGAQTSNGIKSDHVHCACAGKAVGVGEHTACSNKDGWLEVGTADELCDAIATSSLNKPAYLCLSADITVDSYMQVEVGGNAYICLNGMKLDASIRAMGNLTITDCVGTGTVVGPKAYTMRTYGSAVVDIFGGTFTVSGERDDVQVLLLDGSANADLSISEFDSVVNLYNGTIKGTGKTTKAGHCVYLANHGILNMYAGTIRDGYVDTTDSANRFGGNVCVYDRSSRFTMYGGEVKNGTANYAAGKDSTAGMGGNIYVYRGTLQVLGGTVSGGKANGYGGNVGSNNKPTEMTFKNCTIKNGVAAGQFGGNLYLTGAETVHTLENAKITDGKAGSCGGNIFVNSAQEVYIKDCTITGAVGSKGGAISGQGKGYVVYLQGDIKFGDNEKCDILMRLLDGAQSWLSVAELTTKTPVSIDCYYSVEFTVDTVANHPFVALEGKSISEVNGKLLLTVPGR